MKKRKNWLANLLLVLISATITFYFCEHVYRKAIFSNNKSFQKYRFPSLYTEDWDENYWKLAQIWGMVKPMVPHPLLGWNFKGWPKTLFHPEVKNIKGRRPVLLYGDSFAQCIDSTTCFEDYLNNDSLFNDKFYFINYGTGAYGVDQIYTMFKSTFMHYKNPIVIFSFLTNDLERSILTFREGQKPVYEVNNNGELILDTSKYVSSNVEYLKKYPPRITSYLLRKFLYSNANFLPKQVTSRLTGEISNQKKAIALNEKILTDVVNLLRKSNTDFMFLIFQEKQEYKTPEINNWKMRFITQFLNDNNINYLWAKDVIKDGTDITDSKAVTKYHIVKDGHPTSAFNYLISEELKKRILNQQYEKFSKQLTNEEFIIHGQRPYYYSERLDSTINAVKSDTGMYREVLRISNEKKITLDQSTLEFAMWLLWNPEQQN